MLTQAPSPVKRSEGWDADERGQTRRNRLSAFVCVRPRPIMTRLTRCPYVDVRSGTFPSCCVSFFRSQSEKTKHRYKMVYHAAVHPELDEGQAKRRLNARPRKSC